MPRQARGESIDPHEVQIIHCIQRCVRKAFLCGEDSSTGQSYEHRRAWIRTRMEFLCSIFAIDCLTYSVLSNHLHVILRTRHDVADSWTDREVAERWLTLHPNYRIHERSREDTAEHRIQWLVNDKSLISEIRTRLSDISWWMRSLAEPIARRANQEDDCTGRFWEGRFRSQVILDEPSLLACAAYVDLNPVRAATAQTPEESEFTGAKDRIDDLRTTTPTRTQDTHDWERGSHCKKSGWMSPIEINKQSDRPDKTSCEGGRRPSTKGFLSLSLARYLELLDWTGRQLQKDGKSSIPNNLCGILERLGLEDTAWCSLIRKFEHLFKRVAGNSANVALEARRRKQRWLQAPGSILFH